MSHLRDHLQKLRPFSVVVQLGSFRKAAERLHVSQPALSQSVQLLEQAIGCQLLVRTARGVVPTEQGLVVREFAERLDNDLDELDRSLTAAGEPMTGHVRIGSFESLTIALFPGFIAHVLPRFPKLTLSITSGTMAELPDMLLDRRVHVTVSTTPRDDRHLIGEELFTDHYRLYAHPALAIDRRTPVIMVPEATDDAGVSVLDHLAAATTRRRASIALTTFESVKAFALHRVGVAVLPTLVARADINAKTLHEVTLPDAPPDGFGFHRLVARMHRRARSDLRLPRLLGELKRYAATSAP